MRTPSRVVSVLCGTILLVAASATPASEVSERLVAQGSEAYHAGRFEEARELFGKAVAADPTDAMGQHALGLTFLALERWGDAADAFERALALRPDFEEARRGLAVARAEAAEVRRRRADRPKRWEVHALTGVQYDSNVTVAPRGNPVPGIGDRDDVAFAFGAGGRYDPLVRADALLRLEYDLYQTLHPDIDDFDFRAHRMRGTVSYSLLPALWAGIQGGYNHYTLGDHSYLSEPFVLPFASVLEDGWGMLQLTYRYGDQTFLGPPFHDLRDGSLHTAGIDQTFYLGGGRSLSIGYQFEEENPDRRIGKDYQFRSNGGFVGGAFPAWWRTVVDLTYLYRYDDYTNRNSFAGFRKTRQDNGHFMSAGVTRPITEHVSAVVAYYATVNTSNIPLFDYRRHVVSGMLQVTY